MSTQPYDPLSASDDSLTLRWVTRAFFVAASAAWPCSTVPQVTAWAMGPAAPWVCIAAWCTWACLSTLSCPSARHWGIWQASALLLGQGLALGVGVGLGAVIMVANNGGLVLYVLTASFGALSVLVARRGGGDPPQLLAKVFVLFGGAFLWLAYRLGPMGTMRPSMLCAIAAAVLMAALRLAGSRTPRRRRDAATLIQARRTAEAGQSCRDALALMCGCALLHAPFAPKPAHTLDATPRGAQLQRGFVMYRNHVLACLVFIALCFGVGRAMRVWDGYRPPNTQSAFEPEAFVPIDREVLRKTLTQQQYSCTQEAGTEAPFQNQYWDNHAPGLYVDVVSGEPLFSSLDKYDSGTGWPSFSKPLADDSVEARPTAPSDGRTEIVSKHAKSHLGHVFDDGPGPGGQRFCINSAGLRFVPLSELKAQGLGRFLFGFAKSQHWDIATLAGGCFWGTEEILGRMPGVVETQVGYTGGSLAHADYDAVSTGETGHAETVQILYDPKQLSYEAILTLFFKMHDPTTPNRQGNDVGTQYRSAIFYNSPEQKAQAQAVITRVERSGAWGKPLTTQLVALGTFWRAEEHHQKYLEKNPLGYRCHEIRNLTF